MSITKLDIPRALWGRGSLHKSTTGRMCCLGHLAAACGVPEVNLENQGMPSDLSDADIKLLPSDFQPTDSWDDSKITNSAAETNDDSCYSWPDKEGKLFELFGKAGIELTFSGPPDYQNC